MLVFVPLPPEDLERWRDDGSLEAPDAFAVTPALRSSFGFSAADDEEAEHNVLHVAGLAGLLRHGVRLVAVAETTARPVSGDEWGRVHAERVPWRAVTAVFSESDPAAAATVRERLGGVGLAEAWDDPQFADLLATSELLWHTPGEDIGPA